MRSKLRLKLLILTLAGAVAASSLAGKTGSTSASQAKFDQAAAIAKLKELIKGKEKEPAEAVFKNIRSLEGVPAGQLLARMEFGYARSLGVDCTHCHVQDQWEKEDKPQKQITRDMMEMTRSINADLLKKIRDLGLDTVINCTTCHHGQINPALNVPPASAPPSAAPPEGTKRSGSVIPLL
jgi:hypothetical protein